MPDPTRRRFGVFEFDAATRELWREGVAVRLQAQPAQALALLVARAGDIVTREDLRREIWGEETFVDFDRNINFCIAQVRTALGDSADSPRFIRTIPKRGYQFIAPVSLPGANSAPRRRGSVAVLSLVLLGIVVEAWLLLPKPARPGDPPAVTIAITRFDNETGEAAFGRLADALTDSVVGELTVAGNGRYGVIGNAAILRGPREGRDLLAIGAALHARYVVLGQVQRDGGGIRILAHLIRLPEQKHVWVVREDSTAEQAAAGQAALARRIAGEFSRRLDASPTVPSR